MSINKYPFDEEIEICGGLSNEEISDILNENFGFNLIGGDIPTLYDLGAISIGNTTCRFNNEVCRMLSIKNQYNNMLNNYGL